MTVIRPNSVSGINSITANGGDINLFRADGTKADIPIVNNITAGVVTATTFKGAIDATTGTFSGNLGVGGVLTYEDVTNVDSVGVITARGGINVTGSNITLGDTSGSSNNRLKFGAGPDLEISHNGTDSIIQDAGTGDLKIGGSTVRLTNAAINENMLVATENGAVEIYHDNSKKIETSSSGAIVTGIVTATSFSGSGANLTNLPVPTTITVADESSDTTCNPLFVTTTSGNLAPKTGTNLVFNSSSGNLRTGSLFLGTGSNESKTQDGLIMERNSGDGYVHITAGRTGGNYSGFNFYVAGGSGVTKRHSIDYQSNFRFYAADGTTERLRIDNDGQVTKPYQPSFTARSTGTWTHGSSTGYLDIDINMVEEFDVGGNYNGQIFTAPVTGKYFFSYTFQYQCTSGYLVVSLRKGVGGSYSGYGNMHMYPPQQSTKYHGPGIIGIMHLAAGNTVKPVAEVNYPGNQIQNANFSGYLLG